MRILIINPGALGDNILSLPVVAAFRKKFPDAEIVVFSNHPVVSLFDLGAQWRNLDSSGMHRLFETAAPAVTKRADIVVTWMGSSDRNFIANLRESTGGEVLASPLRPPEGAIVHASAHLLESAGFNGDEKFDLASSLKIPGEKIEAAQRFFLENKLDAKKLLVIHPGSGGESKCFPASLFAEVAKRWNGSALLIKGPIDRDRVEAVRRIIELPVAKIEDVASAAALLKNAAAYLGNDSGISHLAAVCGAPTLVLFGPTDPRVWSPTGKKVKIVTVGAPCSPCATEARKDCVDRKCLILKGDFSINIIEALRGLTLHPN